MALSALRYLKSSVALGAAEIKAYVITNAALTYSESFAPGGMDEVTFMIAPGNTATGTSPTIAVALEMSPDGGTTFIPVVADAGATTSIASGALSTGTNVAFRISLPLVESGSASSPLYRFAFTYANADNDFAVVNMWLALRKFGVRTP